MTKVLFLFYFLLLSNCLYVYVCSYKMITPKQWKILQHYKTDKHTSQSMMEKVNYIIFMRHVPLVCSTAKLLGQIHKRKTLNIKQDMLVYGYRGLYDSVRKYDGRRLFINYAKIYIKGSIYKCITDNYTISKIPITERRKSVMKRKPVYQEYENKYKHTTYLRGLDYLSCANNEHNEHNERHDDLLYLWVEINRLDPFVKRLFYYRFDHLFNIKHTNKEVADLMCCSEEHVRQTIKKHISVLIGVDVSDLDNINGVKYIYK